MKLKEVLHIQKVWALIWLYMALPIVILFSAPSGAFAEELTDDVGTTITLTKPFTRIISLYPAHTENLFYLGLDQEIIGVSKNDTFPGETAKKEKFHYREDPEKFLSAMPDLVLIRPMISRGYPDLIAKLNLAGITVVSLQPTSIDEVYTYWKFLGKLTGKEIQAQAMANTFKNGLLKLTKNIEHIPDSNRKQVYFEAIHKKMKTFSPQSISIFVLESAGGINSAADAAPVRKTNIAYYGKERILSKAHFIDVFLAQKGKMNRINPAIIKNEPGFSAIKAVQNDMIYIVEEEIVSRPTMRLLSGIKVIQQYLYPEVTN